jgi:hypothetical protein
VDSSCRLRASPCDCSTTVRSPSGGRRPPVRGHTTPPLLQLVGHWPPLSLAHVGWRLGREERKWCSRVLGAGHTSILLRRETLSTVDHGWTTHGVLGRFWPTWVERKLGQAFAKFLVFPCRLGRSVISLKLDSFGFWAEIV